MKYTVDNICLKHLNDVGGDKINFSNLMIDILGYKNSWWDRRVMFKYKFRKIYELTQQLSQINISSLSHQAGCKIQVPKSIDSLPYQARIEIDQVRQRGSDDIVDLMSQVIALSCFTTNVKVTFDSDSDLFNKWKQSILNQPLTHMVGLYNDLEKSLDESNHYWNRLFAQVHVEDKDYQAVNGPAYLARFNLLSTIKKLIKEFRVTYREAFLMEYRLVMTNNLEDASRGYVGEAMRLHKERVFKAQRNKP